MLKNAKYKIFKVDNKGLFSMSTGNKTVLAELEKLDGISRAWFEWRSQGGLFDLEVVVEIYGDTNPNLATIEKDVIEKIVQEIGTHLTDIPVKSVRIVPKLR